jgi:hypothetical protein
MSRSLKDGLCFTFCMNPCGFLNGELARDSQLQSVNRFVYLNMILGLCLDLIDRQ